jgi:hypothetical protein
MKITITSHGQTHTTEVEHDNLTTEEIAEIITNLLTCAGYGKEGIINAFKEIEYI